MWVYRTDLLDAGEISELAAGALTAVTDPAGRPMGTGLYSSASEIALRLVSREAAVTRAAFLEGVRERVRAAFWRRRAVAPVDATGTAATTAQRLLFAEADGLSGIVADRYGALVVVQLLHQGTALDDVRKVLAEGLREELSPGGEPLTVWERPDPRIRELERLPPAPEGPMLHAGPGEPAPGGGVRPRRGHHEPHRRV